MNCPHETQNLMGTADGIVCRCCGRVFKDFDELRGENAPAPEKAAEAARQAPKKGRKKKEA